MVVVGAGTDWWEDGTGDMRKRIGQLDQGRLQWIFVWVEHSLRIGGCVCNMLTEFPVFRLGILSSIPLLAWLLRQVSS